MNQTLRLILHLFFPERCVYCGKILDFRTLESRNFTDTGRRGHPEWNLCEKCQDIFDFSLPKVCRRCGIFHETRPYGYNGCPLCQKRQFWFDYVVPMGRYRDELRTAIFKMKKSGNERLIQSFARIFFETRSEDLARISADVIIPVPMHPFFRWARGMNDAQILAYEMSKILGTPVCERVVRCSRLSMAQRAVTKAQRFQNVQGVFATYEKKPDRVQWLGKKAMLVDDVMTTGATVNEISRILKTELGFREVVVVVFARARGNVRPSIYP